MTGEESMKYQVVPIDPRNPYCWAIFPELMERVGRFAEEDGHENPVAVTRDLVHNFVAGFLPGPYGFKPWMRAWVLIDENGPKGHVIGEVNFDHSAPFCTVTQYQVDDGHAFPREEITAVWDELMSWAHELGATKVKILARSELHAKAYQTFYKLQPVGKVLMERLIEPGGTPDG